MDVKPNVSFLRKRRRKRTRSVTNRWLSIPARYLVSKSPTRCYSTKVNAYLLFSTDLCGAAPDKTIGCQCDKRPVSNPYVFCTCIISVWYAKLGNRRTLSTHSLLEIRYAQSTAKVISGRQYNSPNHKTPPPRPHTHTHIHTKHPPSPTVHDSCKLSWGDWEGRNWKSKTPGSTRSIQSDILTYSWLKRGTEKTLIAASVGSHRGS